MVSVVLAVLFLGKMGMVRENGHGCYANFLYIFILFFIFLIQLKNLGLKWYQ